MKKNTRPRASSKAATAQSAEMVTLGMVAQAAGVSPATVSRILNGSATVSAEKHKAVDDAIARLGFVPNPMARGLAGGRTLSVGVITQSLDSPFYGGALRGIEDVFDQADYSSLFVSGHWNAAEEARCIDVLLSRRVDGLVILSGRLSDQTLRSLARKLPVVVTGRTLKAPGLFAMDFDNVEGGRIATQHLLELGHQRIAFISGESHHPDANQRQRGYRDALESAGIAFNPALVLPGLFYEESGLLAVQQLIERRERFSAVFAANDQMAFGAALGLSQHGLRVPADVSLMGFDDLASSMYCLPPLSTVHQPVYELGRLAATAMLALLRGEVPDAVMPAPKLVLRSSTQAFAKR